MKLGYPESNIGFPEIYALPVATFASAILRAEAQMCSHYPSMIGKGLTYDEAVERAAKALGCWHE